MKRTTMVFIFLILIVGSLNVDAVNIGESFGLRNDDASYEKVTLIKSPDGASTTVNFNQDNGRFEIKKEGTVFSFENIAKSESGSYIKLSNKGEVLTADFTVGKGGGTYIFNKEMLASKLPEGARVIYNMGTIKVYTTEMRPFQYGTHVISSYSKDNKFPIASIYKSGEINCVIANCIVDGNQLKGRLTFLGSDYLLDQWSELRTNNVLINAPMAPVLIKKNDDPNYKGSYVVIQDKYIKTRILSENQVIIKLLEGNKIFSSRVFALRSQERFRVDFEINGENTIEIFNRDAENKIPEMVHERKGSGLVKITNGRVKFTLIRPSRGLNQEYGGINEKIFLQLPLEIKSTDLPVARSVIMNPKDGYVEYDTNTKENVFVYVGPKDDVITYDPRLGSSVGKEIYEYAEAQLGGNAAFIWNGRRNVYYDKDNRPVRLPSGMCGYDCIGLVQSALASAYNRPLNEFPPTIQLPEKLRALGWKTHLIRPTSVTGDERKVREEIRNIPQGSIVFVMHSTKDYCNQGFNCISDASGSWSMGHTLIKRRESEFINAHPSENDDKDLLPGFAVRYNQQLLENGKGPIFNGLVKVGNLPVVKDDALFVMAPPKDKDERIASR